MKVALVCIAKNEDNYIQEWVDYNLKLGFDKIFIYQNNWRWFGNNENVEKIEFDGYVAQVKAYNDFINKYKNSYDWAAFFDVDEFLVLKKHSNIKSFVSDYQNYDSIGVSWVIFGDNGHRKVVNNDYSVIKRFTKRESKGNIHIKSIVKLNSVSRMDVHNPNTKWVDTDKFLCSGPFNKNPKIDIAQLNHYFTKSFEEFKDKCERGRADTIVSRNISEFDYYTNFCNETEDLNAYNFFINDNNSLFNS